MERRGFLGTVGAFAAASLLDRPSSQLPAQTPGSSNNAAAQVSGRRRLGSLEVSSIGLGVQNMSRTYQTTVPSRPEMINTPAQIALAWLMAQKPWIVPIPGTTQMAHMLDNIGATAVRLTRSELTELNAAVPAIKIQGGPR